MVSLRTCLLIFTLIFLVSCASGPQPQPQAKAAKGGDPINRLVASAALIVSLQLDQKTGLDQSYTALDFEPQRYLPEIMQPVKVALTDTSKLTALDSEKPVYFAITTRGNTPFINAIHLSPVIPVEDYPRWLHIRAVFSSTNADDATLRRQIRSSLETLEDTPPWQLHVVSGEVIADFLIPLGPDAPIAQGPLFNELRSKSRPSTHNVTPARAGFARSTAPTSLYVNYRQLGQLLAIFEANSRFDAFTEQANKATEGRLPLFAHWISGNQASSDVFREFNAEQPTYADVTIETFAEDGDLQFRMIETHSAAEDQRNQNRSRTWHDNDRRTFPIHGADLLAPFKDRMELTNFQHQHYTIRTIEAPRTSLTERKDLPGRSLSANAATLPCALNMQVFTERSLAELQRTAPEYRTRYFDRRMIPVLDQARECEGHHPHLPRISRVLSRGIWEFALREQRAGKLKQAESMYAQACELNDRLSCRYLRRIERSAAIELPVAQWQLTPYRPQDRFAGFSHLILSVDANQRVSLGGHSIGSLDEFSEPARQTRILRHLDEEPLSTPLRLASGDSELRHAAQRTLTVAAPASLDARTLLLPLTEEPIDGDLTLQPLLKLSDETDAQVLTGPITVRPATESERQRTSQRGDDQIRIHLGDNGIQIFAAGRLIPAIPGCPEKAPTICMKGGNTVEGYPIEALFSVMPEIAPWLRGRAELIIVVEADISWGLLTEISLMLQNQNHLVWQRIPRPQILGITPRLGTPFTHTVIALH